MVVAADTVQMDPKGLDRVEALFQEQIQQGIHPGSALAVYRTTVSVEVSPFWGTIRCLGC